MAERKKSGTLVRAATKEKKSGKEKQSGEIEMIEGIFVEVIDLFGEDSHESVQIDVNSIFR